MIINGIWCHCDVTKCKTVFHATILPTMYTEVCKCVSVTTGAESGYTCRHVTYVHSVTTLETHTYHAYCMNIVYM